MLHKKWTILLLVVASFIVLFFTQIETVEAACRLSCVIEACPAKYDGPGCEKGTGICKPRDGVTMCRNCEQICDPEPRPPRCQPTALSCSNQCGQTSRCASDGCGGMTCCPATVACPTPTPPKACVDSDGGSYPNTYGYVTISAPALPETKKDTCLVLETTANTSRWVAQANGTHVGEKTCVNTATGSSADTVIACAKGCADGACLTTARIYCGPNRSCPAGQDCYQPPMPPCTTGACAQVMPAPYCVPSKCPKRHLGDANCDQVVNAADFEVFKSAIRGLKYAATNYSADFNADTKVNLSDYEIWRNTVYPLPGV